MKKSHFFLGLMISFLCMHAAIVYAQTLREYYNTGDDGGHVVERLMWRGHVFTTESRYIITSVRIKANRKGSPGTLWVYIRATSGGLPTGGNLASGSTNANLFTDNSTGGWYEIELSAYELQSGTQYGICLSCPDGGENDWIGYRVDNSGAYPGGTAITSLNGGSSWSSDGVIDGMFETYGTDPPTPIYDSLVVAATFMVSMFFLVFCVHMVYMIGSGNTQNFVEILMGYVVSAIIIMALAVIMLSFE